MPALEKVSISRAMLISIVFYLVITNNKNHNEIGHVILIIFILETCNTTENINANSFIFLKLDELSSQNHTTLSNGASFKQMIIDSGRNGNPLKTKEIYYYNILEYHEDIPTNIGIIGGQYALTTTHLVSKTLKGL